MANQMAAQMREYFDKGRKWHGPTLSQAVLSRIPSH